MPELNQSSLRKTQIYSAAFEELGLSWDWDPAVYGPGGDGLRAYLEKEHPHLLRVYDANFLLQAVEATRARLERAR
ncbi:MAG: hypothetical protein JWP65_2648 [Ramlibacter sp.]|jgi:hypothetical protein|uniref:hypothetical protein n=1 Tax=Ramlibacter sp. TaxID=1917967 RepID=UPI0026333FEC|nr:hypothetical protein [Ramlibacter sp.]MDB5752227.1 hypothetical protein [Ramlibacter sp.]